MKGTSKPELLIRTDDSEQVAEFKEGLAECFGVAALAAPVSEFTRLERLDALYMSLTAAEAWGSRPLPPHTCEVLKNPGSPALSMLPRYAVAGVVLNPGEGVVGPDAVSTVIRAAIDAVATFNHEHGQSIRIVGFANIERLWPGASWSAIGRRVATSYLQGGPRC